MSGCLSVPVKTGWDGSGNCTLAQLGRGSVAKQRTHPGCRFGKKLYVFQDVLQSVRHVVEKGELRASAKTQISGQ